MRYGAAGFDLTLSVHSNVKTAFCNNRKLNEIRRKFGPHSIRLSAPQGAAPLELQAQAQAAARLRDLDTHIATAAGTTRSIPQWDENATWDPGD